MQTGLEKKSIEFTSNNLPSIDSEAKSKEFETAFELELPGLKKYCFYLGLNSNVSNDFSDELFAEVCKKAWENKADLKDIKSIKNWLFQIAKNTARNNLSAKRNSAPHLSISGIDDEDHPEQYLIKDQKPSQELETIENDLVNNFRKNLNPTEKELFTQVYQLGLTPTEIATIQGKNLNTINTHLFRLRQKLEKYLLENK